MKLLLILLFFACLLGGCSSGEETTAQLYPPAQKMIDSGALKLLNGNWINKAYLDSLHKYKSPEKIYNEAPNLLEAFIYSDNIKNDSLGFWTISLHESLQMFILLDSSEGNNFKATDRISKFLITVNIVNGDTILRILKMQNGKKGVGSEFIHIPKDQNGIGYFVNKETVAGTFTYDSADVTFNADGTLNWPGKPYKFYEILTDMCCPVFTTDVITLGQDSIQGIGSHAKNENDFAFRLAQDTLFFYNPLIDSSTDTYVGHKELIYKLVRKR